MAVMTTQFSEPVALEQKTHPVPSSDKMALDLDINGTPPQDETNHDPVSDTALNKSTPSPSTDLATEFPEVNGTDNNAAFSSNQTILTNISEPSFESQPSPTSALDLAGLQDTNTTADLDTATSFDGAQLENGLVSADFAIESAVEDIAPNSTIPPVVEATESDLRDETPPLAPEAHLQEHSLDNSLDSSDQALANQTAELDVDANSPGTNINFDPPPTTISEPSDLPPAQPTIDSAHLQPAQDEPDQPQTREMDTFMNDVPLASPHDKVSRGREDDDEDEPSAKRTKTEDADLSFQETPTQNGNGDHGDDAEITPYGAKELIKIVKNIARSLHGKNFRQPVAKLWPNFSAAYAEKIPHEIDLETMEARLRDENYYRTMGQLERDIRLLYTNALTFNGVDHTITKSAEHTRDALLSKIANVAMEPAPPAPKAKKNTKRSTPVPSARRASRGSHGATLPAAQPAQTFALDPLSNTPLIRRDSTKVDGGRPKREIHPPKNKDLPYSVRPKSKKHAHELKFCEDVLNEVKKSKYFEFNTPFLEPVDPVALNIPHYFTIIKKPMDLDTMTKKLKNGSYTGAADFDKDMKLMLSNCYRFNPAPNPVNASGKRLEQLYQSLWEKKDQYLADRSPPAGSPSAGESDDEDEDEDVGPVDKTQENTLATVKDRLIEEQSKLVTLMSSKYPDQGLIQMQRDMVGVIEKRILEEEALAKSKSKKKPSKPAKKAAPAKKASTSSNSKKSGSTASTKRYMGTLEKEVISAGLGALPDDVSNEVLADIKKERPGIDAGDDGTLELDIDVISVPLLWKIHGLIMRYAPDVQENIQRNMAAEQHVKPQAKAAPKKKNKPMSKYEQERNIGALEKRLDAYQRQSSGSQEPVLPTVEQQDESSGDEESDSEEE